MFRSIAVIALALCAAGCVTRDEPGVLSDGCLINSDCADPLVCAFRRCHTQCDTVRDCPAGLECVPADRPFNVCLLADETCRTQPCPAGLVCGADLLCRAPCSGDPGSNASCLAEQQCVNGGVCASGVFIVDVPDQSAAVEWAKRCPAAEWGTMVVRGAAVSFVGGAWRSS